MCLFAKSYLFIQIDSLELRISELQKRLNYLQGDKNQRDVNPKLRGQLDKPEGEQNVPRHPGWLVVMSEYFNPP